MSWDRAGHKYLHPKNPPGTDPQIRVSDPIGFCLNIRKDFFFKTQINEIKSDPHRKSNEIQTYNYIYININT